MAENLAERRRKFQAMSSARQWGHVVTDAVAAFAIFGLAFGAPLVLVGASWRWIVGIDWLVASLFAFSNAFDLLKTPSSFSTGGDND